MDVDVEPAGGVDALRPQQHVRVGDAEPELVVGHAQQHRIVDDAAVLVAQDDVARLHGRHPGVDVAGNQVIHEGRGVRAFDLDLALDRHVPHTDVLGERLVLRHQPAVLRPDVGTRMVDVVVRRIGPAAGRLRQVPPGRLADPRGDQHLGIAIAALPQVDRQDTLLETVDDESLRHWRTSGCNDGWFFPSLPRKRESRSFPASVDSRVQARFRGNDPLGRE